MPYVSTDDGVRLHYHADDFRDPWEVPSDEAVLLHHGFARSMKWWAQWVPALSRNYRVVRYDVRGCGLSSMPSLQAEWSTDRIVRDAVEVIDSLHIRKVHWVGFESGGLFGMMFAGQYPDRIRSLTLVNTPSDRWIKGRMSPSMRLQHSKASEAIREIGLRQWLVDTMPTRLDPDVASPRLVEWHINEHAKTPTAVATALMDAIERAELSSVPSRIRVPTLIMAGERSPNCPPAEQQELAAQIPEARPVITFPGIGAGIQLLIPNECTDEVLKFLRTV
jgi:3-oxoadipate enol-lactonase